MRKLKLQTQLSLDGYCAGPQHEMDWMVWNWDEPLKAFVKELTEPVDTILLGRNLASGFIPHWEGVSANPSDESFAFGKKMVETHKVVFTKSLEKSEWKNTVLAKGDLVKEVNHIKAQAGKDMIAYGGSTFVSKLIKHNLIDDYFLFINPAGLGKGLPIFSERTNLKLIKSQAYSCGIVVLHYQPAG
jgi:dihydrofolate reductase